MVAIKTEIVGATILAGLLVAGQVVAHKLGIGYEAGCLISLTPVLIGSGLIGINNMVKRMKKNI